ncbi:MAG TPA: DMT family transporter [Candidatus Thermoplasmatota archaeon]|nr:DMT family transporter [Candidatus Thermoplasmatota archaeon]
MARRAPVRCLPRGALAVALWRRAPLRRSGWRDWAAIAAYGGLNVVLHNVFLMAGSKHVPIAVVAIATGLNPLLTLVLARLALPGVRLPPAALAGFAVALAGVGLLALQGGADGGAVDWRWALVVLGGVLAWSSGSVAMKASGSRLPPLALAVWGSLVGALVLQAGAVAFEPMPRIDAPYLGVVAFAGLAGGLAAFLLWGGIVRDYGPQRANLASYVSPVAASLTAWLLLGQPLRLAHAAAYALVALGLTLSLSMGRPSRVAVDAAAPVTPE